MNGDGATSSDASADRRRKPRPEIQIYRPGMLRKGDSTKSLANEERPPRPEKLTSEATSSGSRRRSNDTDSVTSRGGSGSTTPDANVMNKKRFAPNQQSGYTYNSTQSLYDTRRQGGYTEYNGNRSNRGEGGRGGRYQNRDRQPFERNTNRGFNERASMRGDGAIAKRPSTGGRRRNDSINSTQSEMPQSTNDQLHIDTTYDSVSQCGASSAFSMNSLGEAFSFEEMCNNLESFASMDWSKEVENEFMMLDSEEEKRNAMEKEQPKPVEQKKQSNGRLQEANGQSNPPSRRSRNRRNRRPDESDRESSFGGSIAEEEEEEEELRSGERTPTSSRASIQPYQPRMYQNQRSQKPAANNENNGYNRRPNYNHKTQENVSNLKHTNAESSESLPVKKPERRGGYRGEHDDRDADDSVYDGVEHHMSSGRLAGRISIVRREVQNGAGEEKNRPRQKAQSKPDEPTKTIQKRSPSPEMITLKPNRKEEIEKNEGIRIREMTEKLTKLSAAVKKRDVKAAEKVVKISRDLADLYSKVILADVSYAFTANLESMMFRSAYYKTYESMRTGSNSTAMEAKLIRAETSKMLSDGIALYEQLIRKYELTFDFTLDDALVWISGAPTDLQFTTEIVPLPCGLRKYENNTQKIALKSLSRILVALGDLYRYKTLIDGSENYENSKINYQKASLLWSSTGHPYNQLGVVVYYSMLYRSGRRARLVPVDVLSRQRQDRVIDELFYLTRALACTHPYEPSRDRLTQRLDAMRKKVAKYQPKLDEEFGVVKANVDATKRMLRVVQIYVHPVTNESFSTNGEKLADDILQDITKQPKDRLHRRAVSYLCDTFGLLVTKIGMENFSSVSDRAFGFLYASLQKEETCFGAQQLAKFAAMMIYAVQVNVKKDSSPSQNEQLGLSISTLLTFYSILIDLLAKQAPEGSGASKTLLLLPAINILSTWICHTDTQLLLKSSRRLAALPSSILMDFELDSVIQRVKSSTVLKKITSGSSLEDSEHVTYPENLLLSSFFGFFEPLPVKSRQSTDGNVKIGRILMMFEALDVLERSEASERAKEDGEEQNESPRDRKMIIEEEIGKGNRALVVRPEHLIPDTNVLIGNLPLVQKLMETRQFNVLVPIRVKDELTALSKLPKTVHDQSDHDPERGNKAKSALEWMQKEFQKKNDRLSTLTSKGSRVNGITNERNKEMGDDENNDDVILNGAVKYASNFTPSNSQFDKVIQGLHPDYPQTNIHRKTCVLLTGDRGLTIKSMDRNLPCRSIEEFAEWFGIEI